MKELNEWEVMGRIAVTGLIIFIAYVFIRMLNLSSDAYFDVHGGEAGVELVSIFAMLGVAIGAIYLIIISWKNLKSI